MRALSIYSLSDFHIEYTGVLITLIMLHTLPAAAPAAKSLQFVQLCETP